MLHGLVFGETAAVLHVNRFPALTFSVLRRWFTIPATHCLDDFRITDLVACACRGTVYFDRLVHLLEWHFNHDKNPPLSTTCTYLGASEDTLGPRAM